MFTLDCVQCFAIVQKKNFCSHDARLSLNSQKVGGEKSLQQKSGEVPNGRRYTVPVFKCTALVSLDASGVVLGICYQLLYMNVF